MQTLPVSSGRAAFRAVLLLVSLLAATFSFAQSSATGVLTGRVYNPLTNEYVRNAEVRITNTNQTTVSGNGGNFRIANLPAGTVEVVVSYVGYNDVSTSAVIAPNQTTSLSVEFVSRSSAVVGDDNTVVMSEFIVSA